MAQKLKNNKVSLETMEETYCNLDQQIKMLKVQQDFMKEQIIEKFENSGIKKGTMVYMVTQKKTTVDDLAIKTALSVPQWNKIKREVVDKDKLEAAVKMGEIDAELAEKAIERKEIKFLKIS